MAATLAASDVPILILGETGTGKELLARFVHLANGRPADRFVALNVTRVFAGTVTDRAMLIAPLRQTGIEVTLPLCRFRRHAGANVPRAILPG